MIKHNLSRAFSRSALSVAVAVFLAWCVPVKAATLAAYTFAGDTPAASGTQPGTSATDWASGPFSTGTDLPLISGGQYIVPTNRTGESVSDGDTLAKALTNGAYATFTFQPGAHSVSLTELSFDQSLTNGFPTSVSVSIFNSLQGFTLGDELATFNITATGDTVPVTRTVVLSGISELQDFTGNIEWRFYFFDNSDTGSRADNIGNVLLEGSISAVPEPAAGGLLLGALAMVGARRLRSRSQA